MGRIAKENEKESVESSFKATCEKIEEEKYALPKTGIE